MRLIRIKAALVAARPRARPRGLRRRRRRRRRAAPTSRSQENAADEFDDGTRMKELAEAGKIIDRRQVRPARHRLQGRDRRRARRASTSRSPRSSPPTSASTRRATSTWKETISDNREPFLAGGRGRPRPRVVLDHRRAPAGRRPGRPVLRHRPAAAGRDGQRHRQSVDDVKGKEVCSVTGSTSLENVEAEGAKPRGFDTYSECVRPGARRHRRRDDHRRRDPARLRRGEPRRAQGRRRAVLRGAVRRRLLAWTTRRCASGSTTRSRTPSRTAPGTRRSRPRSASPASRRPSRRRCDECPAA